MEGARGGRVAQVRSVSFPPALLARATKRAAELRLSFSAYMQRCVEAELELRPLAVYREEFTLDRQVAEPEAGRAEPLGPAAGEP